MNWEFINGVTGITSALCAVMSLGYIGIHKKQPQGEQPTALSLPKFMAFVLASSGWMLCCLSYLWIFEPYGSYPLDREYQEFFGVLLAFPAVTIFLYAVKVLGRAR